MASQMKSLNKSIKVILLIDKPTKRFMKNYRLRTAFLSFLLLFLIGMAPYSRFYIHNFFTYWPYFNWELGFGSIPYKKRLQIIYIDQIDDEVFSPPIPLNDYILNKAKRKLYWIPTQHYKMQTMLTQANHKKDLDEIKRVKSLIYKYWFQPISKRLVKYHLAIIEIEPMQYQKDGTILFKRVVLEDVFHK